METERDWSQASLAELMDHIVDIHHVFTRHELAKLRGLIGSAIKHQGRGHPELATVQQLFGDLENKIVFHLFKEEVVLFPRLRQGAGTPARPLDIPAMLRTLEAEHQAVGRILEKLIGRVAALRLPAAVPIGEALGRLQADLRQHVYEEDQVLVPRVRAALDGNGDVASP